MGLERYIRLRPIGEGSYGKCSLVEERGTRRQFVLKEIELANAPPKERELAIREAELLQKLDCPYVVHGHETFQEGTILYIVMEYCEGGDLHALISRRQGQLFPEDQVADWFVQIVIGLSYLHAHNVIHRDLKTQNIFLTRYKSVRIGDLGIARILSAKTDLASTFIGSPLYMSPELMQNIPYNTQSDMWALGCVLYEMLTLQPAFNARNMSALILKILGGSVPPVSQSYSSNIRKMMRALLDKSPERRPTASSILTVPWVEELISHKVKRMERRIKHNHVHGNEEVDALPILKAALRDAGVKGYVQPTRPASACAEKTIEEMVKNAVPAVNNKNPAQRPSSSSISTLNFERKACGLKERVTDLRSHLMAALGVDVFNRLFVCSQLLLSGATSGVILASAHIDQSKVPSEAKDSEEVFDHVVSAVLGKDTTDEFKEEASSLLQELVFSEMCL